MAKAAKRTAYAAEGGTLLADRLLALFGFELAGLERSVEPRLSRTEDGPVEGESMGSRDAAPGAKGRIEAIGQMTRTLEKLLELKQLEMLALGGGGEAADAEAERLAAELMKRLRALDRRRTAGPGESATVAGVAA